MESNLEHDEFEMPRNIQVEMLGCHEMNQSRAEKATGISTLQCSGSNSEDTLSNCSHNFSLKAILVLAVNMVGQKEPQGKKKSLFSRCVILYDHRQQTLGIILQAAFGIHQPQI